LSGYVAIVAFLAAYEDSSYQKKLALEETTRQAAASSTIDLLSFAAEGADPGDPCPYVARQRLPDARKLANAAGRKVLSGAEFTNLIQSQKLAIKTLPNGIPKIFHQTWWARKVSEGKLRLSASWLRCMPDWIHVLWDDNEVRELFQTEFPEALPLFDGYPYPVQRSDIFRYLVLDVYGGLYADMDYECVRDISGFDGIGGNRTVYVSGAPNPAVDGFAQNTLMASTPNNPFWPHVMKTASQSCGRMWEPEPMTRILTLLGACSLAYRLRSFMGWTGISVLDTTGPKMVSDAIRTYPRSQDMIGILDTDVFNGQMDRGAKDRDEHAMDRDFPCASKAIHRNSAGWTTNSPFPYTGEHTIMGKRIPHRLIAIIILEVMALYIFLTYGFAWYNDKARIHREQKKK